MDIDALDHLERKVVGLGLELQGQDLGLWPSLADGYVIEGAYDARHAGDLADLTEAHGVGIGSEPAKDHLHNRAP